MLKVGKKDRPAVPERILRLAAMWKADAVACSVEGSQLVTLKACSLCGKDALDPLELQGDAAFADAADRQVFCLAAHPKNQLIQPCWRQAGVAPPRGPGAWGPTQGAAGKNSKGSQ